jgi:hypothetical protein
LIFRRSWETSPRGASRPPQAVDGRFVAGQRRQPPGVRSYSRIGTFVRAVIPDARRNRSRPSHRRWCCPHRSPSPASAIFDRTRRGFHPIRAGWISTRPTSSSVRAIHRRARSPSIRRRYGVPVLPSPAVVAAGTVVRRRLVHPGRPSGGGGVSVRPSRPSSSIRAIHRRAGPSSLPSGRRWSPSIRRRYGIPVLPSPAVIAAGTVVRRCPVHPVRQVRACRSGPPSGAGGVSVPPFWLSSNEARAFVVLPSLLSSPRQESNYIM